jgi:hypothetical protein
MVDLIVTCRFSKYCIKLIMINLYKPNITKRSYLSIIGIGAN